MGSSRDRVVRRRRVQEMEIHEKMSSRDWEFRRWVVEEMGSSADIKFTRMGVYEMVIVADSEFRSKATRV